MAYCTASDVWDYSGLTKAWVEAYTGVADADVHASKFIASADAKIKELLQIPHVIHREVHVYGLKSTDKHDRSVTNFKLELGNFNGATQIETFQDKFMMETDVLDVQGKVEKILAVYVNGRRYKRGSEYYPWTHTSPNGYIEFTDPEKGTKYIYYGCKFHVTYLYDPFKASVPEWLKAASACFASAQIISFCLGVRERDVAFQVEAETGIRIPDRETLHHRRGSLIARAKEYLASYGYGFKFRVI